MTNIQNKIAKVEIPDGYIFEKYEFQQTPQDIHLTINGESNIVEFDYDHNIGGGYSADQFHNRELVFTLSGTYLPRSEAIEILKEINDLLDPLLESYESLWNGNNNIGHWDVDLVEQIRQIVENFTITEEEGDALPGEVYEYYYE